jgi:hypothetical protein
MLRRRHLLLGLLAILTTIGVFVVLEITWAMTARSDRDVDYGAQIDALVTSRLNPDPTEPNHWPKFIAALDAFYTSLDKVRVAGNLPTPDSTNIAMLADYDAVRAGTAPPDVASATDMTLAAIASDPAADFGPRLDALAHNHHFVRPIGGSAQPLYEVLLPEIGQSRHVGRHELLLFQCAFKAGNADAARTHLTRVLLLSRVIGQQGCLLDQMFGYAIRNLAFEEITALMIENPPDAAMIDAITAAFESQFPGFQSPPLFVGGEQVFSLDLIQRTFDSSGYGSGRFIPSEALSLPFVNQGSPMGVGALPRNGRLPNMLWFLHASREQTEDKLREYYDLVERHLKAPPAARKGLPSLDQFAQDLPPRYAILRLTMPALSSALAKSRVASDQLRALRIILAIERYRLANSNPPETLASLAPDFLPDLPTSTLSGGPFLYKRLDSPDTFGRTYILYLPGLDELDNGGIETLPPTAATATTPAFPGTPPNQPYLAVLNQGASAGLDFILTRPRQAPAR